MDLKNTTILLMLLICILGLIVGVYYTEISESSQSTDTTDEAVNIDLNETITIHLEENKSNTLSRFFT